MNLSKLLSLNNRLTQDLCLYRIVMANEIIMLGTGNAFLPNGRHHSFAIIDKCHIIDAPPTALISLRENGIKISNIETIFITHLHGDHVFGLPFLLLERTYISDRELVKPLTIVAAPGARERIEEICHLAYPNSLMPILSKIIWQEAKQGQTENGLMWNRFKVNHDEKVDPHGYKFITKDGAKFTHSGDSGPCVNLTKAISETDLIIIEMSIPNWVPSPFHHKPSDIEDLGNSNPEKLFVITHTFIDDKYSKFEEITTKEFPKHPENVIHAGDGTVISWENGWSIRKIK